MIVEANYNKFTGIYQNNNTANRVYKYRFIIKDSNNIIFDDSDWRIHDSSNDIIENSILISKDFYTTNKIYDPIVSNYIVEYQIELMKPVDGIKIFSSETNISITTEYPSNLRTSLKLEYDRENAYINISMNDAEWNQLGYFKLLRADSTNGYTTWTPIKKFAITNTKQFVYQDKTVQQGVGYTYAYQEYGVSGNHSMIYGKAHIDEVDFDYAYLGDKDRQIKLAFDNEVSSFKDTILENKVETLGSKYPFFFRNNDVRYKEFPITGLISYHLDDEELFMRKEEIGINNINWPSTNQEGYNFTAERKFRLELLDWLNNGQEKLFRSPSEGNLVVRLMNVSLSPKKELSRMIWSFSSTAYECASAAIEDIVAAGRLLDAEILDIQTQVSIIETKKITDINGPISCGDKLTSFYISGAMPGTQIVLSNDGTAMATYTVGATGALAAENLPAANSFTINLNNLSSIGIITYTYLFTPQVSMIDNQSYTIENMVNTFDNPSSIDFTNILEVYYLIFETSDVNSDSWFQLNEGNKIHYKGTYTINSMLFGDITNVNFVNSKVTMYYKVAMEG